MTRVTALKGLDKAMGISSSAGREARRKKWEK